ncbi:hypothetical protein BC937DRAFT_92004 [Endogone sp. FLAS-F59071]|nr:hypothetical protein BC937DRAFT_92004 [Endogone sp. FLAS-F59071]|eukprot:RUS15780.1 hypothetical protein BC937DRAFT_92004 [Endogone sp. FLAS-F59071]
MLTRPLTVSLSFITIQGGVKRYPYPKEVWSPSGGWWSQPKAWKANTVITVIGLTVVTAGIWRVSAEREVHAHNAFRITIAVAAQGTDSVDPVHDGMLVCVHSRFKPNSAFPKLLLTPIAFLILLLYQQWSKQFKDRQFKED